MSSHGVTVTGYVAIAVVGIALQLAALRPGSRIPTLAVVLRRAMRTRSGRVGIVTGWAWLGLHFFVR